jgi:hypothetical protein
MDKVQKHNSFNTNTPSSESYRNYLVFGLYHPVVPNSLHGEAIDSHARGFRMSFWSSDERKLNHTDSGWYPVAVSSEYSNELSSTVEG